MIIMFVRHADAKNDTITDRGNRELSRIVDYDEEYEFSKMYCSPLNRCVKTAERLNEKFNLKIQIEKDLKEREQLESSPKTKDEKLWYDNYLNPEFENINPEGCKNYLKRSFKVFDKIINENFDENKNAIIVAHSGTAYALLAYVNGISKGKNIKWMRVGNCSKLYFEINEKV